MNIDEHWMKKLSDCQKKRSYVHLNPTSWNFSLTLSWSPRYLVYKKCMAISFHLSKQEKMPEFKQEKTPLKFCSDREIHYVEVQPTFKLKRCISSDRRSEVETFFLNVCLATLKTSPIKTRPPQTASSSAAFGSNRDGSKTGRVSFWAHAKKTLCFDNLFNEIDPSIKSQKGQKSRLSFKRPFGRSETNQNMPPSERIGDGATKRTSSPVSAFWTSLLLWACSLQSETVSSKAASSVWRTSKSLDMIWTRRLLSKALKSPLVSWSASVLVPLGLHLRSTHMLLSHVLVLNCSKTKMRATSGHPPQPKLLICQVVGPSCHQSHSPEIPPGRWSCWSIQRRAKLHS